VNCTKLLIGILVTLGIYSTKSRACDYFDGDEEVLGSGIVRRLLDLRLAIPISARLIFRNLK